MFLTMRMLPNSSHPEMLAAVTLALLVASSVNFLILLLHELVVPQAQRLRVRSWSFGLCPPAARAAGSVSGASATNTEMSEVTYYVALPFVAADDGIAPGEAVECINPNAAVNAGRGAVAEACVSRRGRLQPVRRRVTLGTPN